MKDRVPTYPGRVKLTPVSGQTNVYDLERADAPTEAGTPLNKANLLTDETATTIGLTAANATVNNALAATFAKAVEAKTAATTGLLAEKTTYVGTGTASRTVEFSAPPEVVFVFDIRGSVYAPFAAITPYGGVALISAATNGNASLTASLSGNALTWGGTSGNDSMNAYGATYYCLAFLSVGGN